VPVQAEKIGGGEVVCVIQAVNPFCGPEITGSRKACLVASLEVRIYKIDVLVIVRVP
jgi:hypothetical protein